jgi:hypothetical protein
VQDKNIGWRCLRTVMRIFVPKRAVVKRGNNLHRLLFKGKAVPLHAMEALGGRGGIAPTHSRPRH